MLLWCLFWAPSTFRCQGSTKISFATFSFTPWSGYLGTGIWCKSRPTLCNMQCSKLRPSYEFHFEGLSNFNPSIEGSVQLQGLNPRNQKCSTKLILQSCMNYKVHVSSTMWRSENQPSNSTSCGDCALLRWLVLVTGKLYWGLQVRSSFCNMGLRFEGLVLREVYFEGPSRVWKGIEGFNLEHLYHCLRFEFGCKDKRCRK